MCEMTSMGEISAARMTIPGAVVGAPAGDLRRALTTSLTPRLRVLFFAAIVHLISYLFSSSSSKASFLEPIVQN